MFLWCVSFSIYDSEFEIENSNKRNYTLGYDEMAVFQKSKTYYSDFFPTTLEFLNKNEGHFANFAKKGTFVNFSSIACYKRFIIATNIA